MGYRECACRDRRAIYIYTHEYERTINQQRVRKTARRFFDAAEGESGTSLSLLSPPSSSLLLLLPLLILLVSIGERIVFFFFFFFFLSRGHVVDHLPAGTIGGGEGEREAVGEVGAEGEIKERGMIGELMVLVGVEAEKGDGEGEGEGDVGADAEDNEEGGMGGCFGLVWINLHLVPYGQVPRVWKVLHISVLYLGCLNTGRNSCFPWANWHFVPYLQLPVSTKDLHNSVLYRFCAVISSSNDVDNIEEGSSPTPPLPPSRRSSCSGSGCCCCTCINQGSSVEEEALIN